MTKFIINPADVNEILSIEGCRDEIEKLIGKNDERKKKLLKIINHYGVNNQQRKLTEEVFELQEAITLHEKELDNFDINTDLNNALILGILQIGKDNITEEIADVLNMVEQFMYYYDIDVQDVIEIKHQKINRQLERIKVELNETSKIKNLQKEKLNKNNNIQ